jgi:hypothetical protein
MIRVGGAPATIKSREPIALLDGTFSAEEVARARHDLAPWRPRILDTDLIWLWRSDLQQAVAGGVPLVAITRWDKAVLFSGLAREAALSARQTRTGIGMFRTEIRA